MVRFGVERRHRGPLSPRSQQYIYIPLAQGRDEREKVLEVGPVSIITEQEKIL